MYYSVKQEKRAVSNWTLLVTALLIRETLQRCYGMKGPTAGGGLDQLNGDRGGQGLSSEEEGEGGPNMAAATLAQTWPQNRQEQDSGTGGPNGRKGASKITFSHLRKGADQELVLFCKTRFGFNCKANQRSPEVLRLLSDHPPRRFLMKDGECNFFCFFRCC
ncbi:hypothetical protein J4Q44_G00260830 [Coregonus suidteri]|uniref:Uncharacterized protein n=1 Tax=Coregonus suidteri TaxID=861788 RepID=A0AAN8L7Y0_9TELE